MSGATPLWGKYRGRVIDNVDPLSLGRIVADVPALAGAVVNWALPCQPYAGAAIDADAIPPIGTSVWIEFEGGDPDYPIWAGCFWTEDDVVPAS